MSVYDLDNDSLKKIDDFLWRKQFTKDNLNKIIKDGLNYLIKTKIEINQIYDKFYELIYQTDLTKYNLKTTTEIGENKTFQCPFHSELGFTDIPECMEYFNYTQYKITNQTKEGWWDILKITEFQFHLLKYHDLMLDYSHVSGLKNIHKCFEIKPTFESTTSLHNRKRKRLIDLIKDKERKCLQIDMDYVNEIKEMQEKILKEKILEEKNLESTSNTIKHIN